MNYIIGVLYHPPRARYNTNELVDRLQSDIEELISLHPGSSLLLVGDFKLLHCIACSVQYFIYYYGCS